MVPHSFGQNNIFFDPVDIHTYEQKISLFHHISNFLTIFWLLLHCFHAEASFVVSLLFYNGDAAVVLALHKRRLD